MATAVLIIGQIFCVTIQEDLLYFWPSNQGTENRIAFIFRLKYPWFSAD